MAGRFPAASSAGRIAAARALASSIAGPMRAISRSFSARAPNGSAPGTRSLIARSVSGLYMMASAGVICPFVCSRLWKIAAVSWSEREAKARPSAACLFSSIFACAISFASAALRVSSASMWWVSATPASSDRPAASKASSPPRAFCAVMSGTMPWMPRILSMSRSVWFRPTPNPPISFFPIRRPRIMASSACAPGPFTSSSLRRSAIWSIIASRFPAEIPCDSGEPMKARCCARMPRSRASLSTSRSLPIGRPPLHWPIAPNSSGAMSRRRCCARSFAMSSVSSSGSVR